MTRLVKAAASDGLVHRFVVASAASSAAPTAEDPRLLAATEEIERLLSELALVRADAANAQDAARDEGRRQGAEEAAAAADKRLASLDSALASAAARLEEKLAGMEELAAALAAAALAGLVAPDADMSDLVARSIARQMRFVRGEAVLAIRVSAADFLDDVALEALAAQGTTGSARLLVDPALGAGECRIDLTLGHIDLGVRGRWREAAALLAELAAEERP